MTAATTSDRAVSFGAAFAGPQHQPFTLPGTHGGAALLVHGFPGTPAEMRPLAERIHEHGWTARAILLPGFGPELDTIAERSAEEWRAAVTTALTALRRDHDRVVLLGHSMGGALALAAAAQVPPDALLLLAPFWTLKHPLWALLPALRIAVPQFKPFRLVKFDPHDSRFREGVGQFMPGVALDDPQVQAGIRDFAIPTRLFAEIRRAGQMGAAAAPQVTAPTVVLQGRADPLVRPETTRELVGRLRTSAEYHETPGGHDLVDPQGDGWKDVQQYVADWADRHHPGGKA